ncbi:hypothetical protein SeMB42_g02468 [Synchytrium endobioticum]|uniref:Uncharacterized protein n=1 Tax=Synchytrium endobioticum TaxID=286115 RepID=A0A507DET0_9FUNG|nr:hypothetical protein SeLEV6574_g01835 [Synchytrium endobioticum]TPX49825.1 hypothetical protein SeMB42_g02468 [Synchytrium endobioticum]
MNASDFAKLLNEAYDGDDEDLYETLDPDDDHHHHACGPRNQHLHSHCATTACQGRLPSAPHASNAPYDDDSTSMYYDDDEGTDHIHHHHDDYDDDDDDQDNEDDDDDDDESPGLDPADDSDPEHEDDIPADVGNLMNAATAESGLGDYGNAVIWEDDAEALKEMEEAMDEDQGQRHTRKAARRRARESNLTDDQAKKIGQANTAFTLGDFAKATALLKQVIKDNPNAKTAWITLATILEQQGEFEKSLQCYMLAAHLGTSDPTLWKELAIKFRRAANVDQALYCINRAIRADKDDVDALWDRSVLLVEKNRYKKAAEGFLAILKLVPHNPQVIRELEKLYRKMSLLNRAIDLYEDLIELDKVEPLQTMPDEDAETTAELDLGATVVVPCRMRYLDVNSLASLYVESGQYERGITVIKQCVRRMQGRANETHWDFRMDDQEYYEGGVMKDCERMPIELRTQLGICRLMLNQNDLAQDHFRRLFLVAAQYPEQLHLVGEAFAKKRMFDEALEAFEQTQNPDSTVAIRIAYCYFQIGRVHDAVTWYRHVLQVAPDDVKAKEELATVYQHMGEEEKAFELTQEIKSLQVRSGQPGDDQTPNKRKGTRTKNGGIANESRVSKEPAKARVSAATKAQREAEGATKERELEAENKLIYQASLVLYTGIGNEVRRAQYIEEAFKLIARFTECKVFYPSDRQKKFTGFRSRKGHENTQPCKGYQGLSFDEWYSVFIKCAYALIICGRSDQAQSILKKCHDANVYYHDESKSAKLHIHMMATALMADSMQLVAEHARWFVSNRPYLNDTYRLFTAALTSGTTEALGIFASSNTQKLLARHLKVLEKQIKDGKSTPQDINVMLLLLYGHTCNTAKAYQMAIWSFLRAVQLVPTDPFVTLSLGMAYLNRACMKKVDEKHRIIALAFTFIFKYYELEKESPEAAYNVGRALHQVGLRNLAYVYYQRVLNASDHDRDDDGGLAKEKQNLKMEAAYNLHLLLCESGNAHDAAELLQKYIVIG